MTNDFAQVESIVRAAAGTTMGGELTFSFPEVVEVIKRCTENQISVLGVELFEVRPAGYITKSLSDYDQRIRSGPEQQAGWEDYVRDNNLLADDFVRLHPTGDGHIYVLTTASWREFQEMK